MSERSGPGGAGTAGPVRAGPAELPVEGVALIDHTADVGFEVRAPDLPGLIRRAVFGMDWLLREAGPPPATGHRTLRVAASAPAGLLRAALREVLLWQELDGFAPAELHDVQTSRTSLLADVVGGVPDTPPVREIKGVTLHQLAADEREDGWWGRVVFDV